MASRDRLGRGGWVRPSPVYDGSVSPEAAAATGTEVETAYPPLYPILDWGRWGEWDATQHYGPSTVLVVGDAIVLYYTSCANGHEPEGSRSDGEGKNVYRNAIGRATLRLDGFVSLRAGDREAVITTRPLVLQGRELVVNADCPRGALTVEVLDEDGKPLQGYTRKDADRFTGDAVRHVATWKGGADVSPLAGKTVRLRFYLRDGDLYSFAAR
jgi:hypothetical protein